MNRTNAEAAIIFGDGIVHGAYWAGMLLVRANEDDSGRWVPVIQKMDTTVSVHKNSEHLVQAATDLFPIEEWEEQV